MNLARSRSYRTVLGACALLMLSGTCTAQVWTLTGGSLSTRAEAYTERNGAVLCNVIQDFIFPPPGLMPGFLGSDFGQFVSAGCGNMIFTCPLSAGAYGDVRVDGVGSPLLRVRWREWASTRHVCPETVVPLYRAYAEVIPFNPVVSLDAFGVPGGTILPVTYAWSNRSAAISWSEAGGEDLPTFVSGTSLTAQGVGDLFALGGFNFDVAASGLRQGGAGGVFNQTAGTPWSVALSGDVRAEINFPGKGFANKDGAGTYHYGELWLTLDPILFPIPPGVGYVPNPTLEFSLDIGSDTELSPPVFDGDETFDPGDVYPWFAPVYAGPTNGTLDDAAIFAGTDIAPDPFAPLGLPNSAPTCAGQPIPLVVPQYFDLDDTDRTDFNLGAMVDPILPVPAPISAFPSACVWEATNLIWSYDDDEAAHYTGVVAPFPFCATPTNSLSPILFQTWGQTNDDDEVLSGLVIPGAVPTTVGAQWGVASESILHPNLAVNPDTFEDDDDDVDGLDVVGDVLANGQVIDCPFRYFSADHEAVSPLGLDPGDVYLVTPGGPVLAVDDVVHLGIPDSCDLDAFEFAFAPDPWAGGAALALAIIFSVDDDDPLTPGDESGGLDPAMVYVSYFQGFSQPFLTAPLDDDVDALAVYADALPPVQVVPNEACCYCNGTCADLTVQNCLSTLGFPQGPGTFCAAGVCETYGACCIGAVCVDNLTPTSCLNNGGIYQGDCVSCAIVLCAPTGACCFSCVPPPPTPPCPDPRPLGPPCIDNVTQADCVAVLHGVYRGNGSVCQPTPGGPPLCRCRGDVNGDGVTNISDFNILASNFGGGVPNCRLHSQGDLNCDGVVNIGDFNMLAGDFGCQ